MANKKRNVYKLKPMTEGKRKLSSLVTVTETILSAHPIAGLGLGAVGAYLTKKLSIIKRKNNWISVIR